MKARIFPATKIVKEASITMEATGLLYLLFIGFSFCGLFMGLKTGGALLARSSPLIAGTGIENVLLLCSPKFTVSIVYHDIDFFN